MRSKLSSMGRFYLFLLILAIGIAALTILLLSHSMTPYQLKLLKEGTGSRAIVYHDFNRDGISESVSVRSDYEGGGYIMVKDFEDQVIDQCNYREPLFFNRHNQWLFFADYNGDNLDDVFAFTQKDDSLFLYIHDLHLKRVVLNRQFLLKAEKHPTTAKHFTIYSGGLINLNNEGKKGVLFSAALGGYPQSRGVYIFNIAEKKIDRRFVTNAWWTAIFLYDLTGDGKEEIVLTARATGNIHEPVPYTDQKCWLFVLDQNLRPIFQPLSLGKYFSEFSGMPIEIDSQRYLLLKLEIGYDKNLPDQLLLVNQSGKILPKKEFKFSNRSGIHKQFVINQSANKNWIYTWLGENEIIKLDQTLQISQKKETPFEEIAPLEIQDLNKDGSNEILCWSLHHISIFSEGLDLLASFPKSSSEGVVTLRHRGPGLPVDIGLNGDDGFYLFAFEKNLIYSLMPLFGFGLWAFLFFLLIGTYKASSRLLIHFKYNRFSLVDSAEGALMLDQAGIIMKANNRIQQLVTVSQSHLKGKPFTEALNDEPKLVKLIRGSMSSGKAVQGNIPIARGNQTIEAKVNITPFKFPLKILNCYLVEIIEDAESALSEKVQIWSKVAAKMFHDIKNRLAVVGVKLNTLSLRLENMQTPENEKINEDIHTIREEIRLVQAITKSFLKFSDIEKPNFQAVNIRQIIGHTFQRFQSYIDGDLRIETEIEERIKEVRADAQQVEFVLGSLIENSIEALNGSGLIKISATLAQYLGKSFQEMVEVEVADTGDGIESDVAEHIFKPHVTTKAEGTGMGLAMAKKIIEDHGGSIGLYSKKDFGTTIRFSLPVYQHKN